MPSARKARAGGRRCETLQGPETICPKSCTLGKGLPSSTQPDETLPDLPGSLEWGPEMNGNCASEGANPTRDCAKKPHKPTKYSDCTESTVMRAQMKRPPPQPASGPRRHRRVRRDIVVRRRIPLPPNLRCPSPAFVPAHDSVQRAPGQAPLTSQSSRGDPRRLWPQRERLSHQRRLVNP